MTIPRDVENVEADHIMNEWVKYLRSSTCVFIVLDSDMEMYWHAVKQGEALERRYMVACRSRYRRLHEIVRLMERMRLTMTSLKKKTQKKRKQKQEGLGPREVALRALKKNQQKKEIKWKINKTNQKIPKNELFSYQSEFSFFGGGVQNSLFLTTWPRKCAPPKHYKHRGFSTSIFEKQLRHETAIFGQKKPNPEIPVIIFFSVNNKKTHESAETPIFIVF